MTMISIHLKIISNIQYLELNPDMNVKLMIGLKKMMNNIKTVAIFERQFNAGRKMVIMTLQDNKIFSVKTTKLKAKQEHLV